VDIVRRLAELLEVGTECLGGHTALPVPRQRRRTLPLGQLLPVRPEQEPVVDVLRGLEPERPRELALQLGVRAVVGPANDVADLEVVVVNDACQVIRGRAVPPQQGRTAEADRAVGVGIPNRQRRLPVAIGPLALPRRPFVPGEPEPLEILQDRVDRPRHLARPVGVVDPQQQPLAAAPVRDRRQGAAEVQRPGRARREADSRGHGPSLRMALPS
jgi:hypothetical protein